MLRIGLPLFALLLAGVCAWLVRRRRARQLYLAHSLSAQALHALIESGEAVQLYDTRLPLDLLADAHIIPGAKHLSPGQIHEHPELIPMDQETIVYCTCPSEETTERIVRRVRAAGYTRVRFLRGGLAAWREAGYPLQDFNDSFELNSFA